MLSLYTSVKNFVINFFSHHLKVQVHVNTSVGYYIQLDRSVLKFCSYCFSATNKYPSFTFYNQVKKEIIRVEKKGKGDLASNKIHYHFFSKAHKLLRSLQKNANYFTTEAAVTKIMQKTE